MSRTSKHPRKYTPVTLTDLEVKLRGYDRSPFHELLAMYLECYPDPESIQAFANKYPDRYFTALGHLARVSGYTDKTETSINVNVNIGQLSDSQLEDRMREMAKQLNLPTPEIIDITPDEVGTADTPNAEPEISSN